MSESTTDALAVFFREVWEESATGAGVRQARAHAAATNPVEPGVDIPATAFLQDGRVLGYLSTLPVKFWNGTAELPAHWLKGFMVLPEFRNGPVGFNVLKEILKHVSVSGIMTVAAPARRLFTAVGYKDCGTLPNFIGILRPARIASRLDVAALSLGLPRWLEQLAVVAQRLQIAPVGGAAAGIAISALRLARGGRPRYLTDAAAELPPAAEVDALWHRARTALAAGAVRDAAFLSWRYAPARDATYESVNVKTATGELAAVGIVRRPREVSDSRLRGLKIATLSDVLFHPHDADAGLAVLAGAERAAHRMGADALACSASHPAIVAALHRRAFVRLPGNVHLMMHTKAAAAGLPTALDSWWVTRGDAESDEVF